MCGIWCVHTFLSFSKTLFQNKLSIDRPKFCACVFKGNMTRLNSMFLRFFFLRFLMAQTLKLSRRLKIGSSFHSSATRWVPNNSSVNVCEEILAPRIAHEHGTSCELKNEHHWHYSANATDTLAKTPATVDLSSMLDDAGIVD